MCEEVPASQLGDKELRIEAAQFVRAKLDYLAELMLTESKQFADFLRIKSLPKMPEPLNLVKTDDFTVKIEVRTTYDTPAEPMPLLFTLDSFYKDLRGYLEFATRAIALSLGGKDKKFSFSSFLCHIEKSDAGSRGQPNWISELRTSCPDFVSFVVENIGWLKWISSVRTSHTHFKIRFKVGREAHAVWNIGETVSISEPEDWLKIGPPATQEMTIDIDGETLEGFIERSLRMINGYRIAATSAVPEL